MPVSKNVLTRYTFQRLFIDVKTMVGEVVFSRQIDGEDAGEVTCKVEGAELAPLLQAPVTNTVRPLAWEVADRCYQIGKDKGVILGDLEPDQVPTSE